MEDIVRLGGLRRIEQFIEHLATLGLDLPVETDLEAAPASPLAQPLSADGLTAGNRFCVHPMEGWDCLADGNPGPNTTRRWERFGRSGAKLIWGCEAAAVRHDGRANPQQLVVAEHTVDNIAALYGRLRAAHEEAHGSTDGLVVGLQLTHSGRFCKPNDWAKLEPRIAYHHPLLDARFHIPPDYPVLTDEQIREYIADYARAAKLAQQIGFDFVDLKHCHGYLGHELLSAYDRPGDFGGSFEGRTRFLVELVEAVRAAAPGLHIGVRLSAFDRPPFKPDPAHDGADGKRGRGVPDSWEQCLPYPGFGLDREHPLQSDLSETRQFLALLDQLGIHWVNLTAGSPYYNPHLQRPAFYPPSDGYQLFEDPLYSVAAQIHAVRELQAAFPQHAIVGTGYTYLQEWLPHVAQAVVRQGWVGSIGLGRMVLSYPELPADVLAGRKMVRKAICRTFSDCTTGPRNALVSGCYPLDPYYRDAPEHEVLKQIKEAQNV
ncbi:MAG TPA: NADH:flavin oxidoreductase [Armatimonadetes bacterium]|mgnify:CR=1 FL=1|nr:NADH:flavin oxidoreductase [Armatimonadota bacterium]